MDLLTELLITVFTALIIIAGLFGETWNASEKKLTKIGCVVAVLGLSVLVFSIISIINRNNEKQIIIRENADLLFHTASLRADSKKNKIKNGGFTDILTSFTFGNSFSFDKKIGIILRINSSFEMQVNGDEAKLFYRDTSSCNALDDPIAVSFDITTHDRIGVGDGSFANPNDGQQISSQNETSYLLFTSIITDLNKYVEYSRKSEENVLFYSAPGISKVTEIDVNLRVDDLNFLPLLRKTKENYKNFDSYLMAEHMEVIIYNLPVNSDAELISFAPDVYIELPAFEDVKIRKNEFEIFSGWKCTTYLNNYLHVKKELDKNI